MKYLIWDVETTGLPVYSAPADADYQPRMCSIAAALVEEDGSIEKQFYHLIKPEGWPLDDARFVANMDQARDKAHGLTFEKLEAEGIPVAQAYEEWTPFHEQASYVVGFNVWFDHKVTRGEWKRLGHPIPFRDKQGICLMKSSTDLCAIERKAPGGGFKFPKLGEAVQILLGREHDRAHSADGDLSATIELFRYLHAKGTLVIEDQPEAKNKPEAA